MPKLSVIELMRSTGPAKRFLLLDSERVATARIEPGNQQAALSFPLDPEDCSLVDLIARWQDAIRAAYADEGEASRTEFLLGTRVIEFTATFPIDDDEVRRQWSAVKNMAIGNDRIGIMLYVVAATVGIEISFDDRERPTSCSIVLGSVAHGPVSKFITRSHGRRSIAQNGELIANALADGAGDPRRFDNQLWFLRPLRVTY